MIKIDMNALCILVTWICFCVGSPFWTTSFINDTTLQKKVWQSTLLFDARNVPVSQRSLVIYRLGEISSGESLDVVENNVKIFSAAVQSHLASANHQAYYIFRVVGGKKNKLARHLPSNLANVALSKCAAHAKHDLAAHVHTIQMLGEEVVSKFHSILFLSHEARGPFEDRANGAWWNRIVSVFNSYPHVGVLGSSISCELTPHVQSHALALRSDAAVRILLKSQIKGLLETGLTTTALKLGYNISSLFYQRRWNETVFTGKCRHEKGNYPMYDTNPSSWCDVQPEDALFMKWGGAPLSLRGYYSQQTIDNIRAATLKIAEADQSVHLALPETIFGGQLYALSKEYDLERWNDRFVQHLKFNSLSRGGQEPQKVCFLVRSAIMHGRNAARSNANEVRMDLDLFISSLMRQTNINWEAYFFVTDDQPFDEELQEILHSHNDIRLKFLDIDRKFRPKYNRIDAAYPASDEALRLVMQKPECVRLSVTNGDNAYGSEVVDYVLSAKAAVDADLVLLPMDSRNFASSDCRQLRARFKNEGYGGYCRYFEKRFQKYMYGFARKPVPVIGGVDIASVFIDRRKLSKDTMFFNEFSSEKKPSTCVGCQDGAWVYAMVRKHKWTTHIPPFSGLKHMVFHGPSPLWCIASGNVWFDHPDHVACVSHAAVGRLNATLFDLPAFHNRNSSRTCLRLSKEGFKYKDEQSTVLA